MGLSNDGPCFNIGIYMYDVNDKRTIWRRSPNSYKDAILFEQLREIWFNRNNITEDDINQLEQFSTKKGSIDEIR
jgi:hypothetical protein